MMCGRAIVAHESVLILKILFRYPNSQRKDIPATTYGRSLAWATYADS